MLAGKEYNELAKEFLFPRVPEYRGYDATPDEIEIVETRLRLKSPAQMFKFEEVTYPFHPHYSYSRRDAFPEQFVDYDGGSTITVISGHASRKMGDIVYDFDALPVYGGEPFDNVHMFYTFMVARKVDWAAETLQKRHFVAVSLVNLDDGLVSERLFALRDADLSSYVLNPFDILEFNDNMKELVDALGGVVRERGFWLRDDAMRYTHTEFLLPAKKVYSMRGRDIIAKDVVFNIRFSVDPVIPHDDFQQSVVAVALDMIEYLDSIMNSLIPEFEDAFLYIKAERNVDFLFNADELDAKMTIYPFPGENPFMRIFFNEGGVYDVRYHGLTDEEASEILGFVREVIG